MLYNFQKVGNYDLGVSNYLFARKRFTHSFNLDLLCQTNTMIYVQFIAIMRDTI